MNQNCYSRLDNFKLSRHIATSCAPISHLFVTMNLCILTLLACLLVQQALCKNDDDDYTYDGEYSDEYPDGSYDVYGNYHGDDYSDYEDYEYEEKPKNKSLFVNLY